MTKEKKLVDTSKENFLQEFLSIKPRLSSHQYEWKGINFSNIEVPPVEVPEHVCPQHIISIPYGLPHKGLSVETLINGKMRSEKYYSGDIIFDPAHTPRRVIHTSSARVYSISLDPSIISQIDCEQFNPDSIELLPIFRKEDSLILQIGKAINKELEFGYPFQAYIDSLKTCLATHLIKNYASTYIYLKEYKGGLSDNKLSEVTEYINNNLSKNISINDLSESVGISQYYFSRLFKQSIGISPYQYIIQRRIDKAKNLLCRQELDIAEIALHCGFAHQSHLNRYFKKLTGTTPNKYRHAQN
ncbi:helix-turn-helix domain-containing protein [Acaryochloris marina NIES-2412]|uniref:helix-turn-helix domain-containing protein n=1 Tax=Acaryochloris marina TaxID=155978 RepID=UPI004059243C